MSGFVKKLFFHQKRTQNKNSGKRQSSKAGVRDETEEISLTDLFCQSTTFETDGQVTIFKMGLRTWLFAKMSFSVAKMSFKYTHI